MRRGLAWPAVSLLLLLSQGTGADEPRLIDSWPRNTFTFGLNYSPAPKMLYTQDGAATAGNAQDQSGAQFGYDWRFFSYALVGLQLNAVGTRDGYAVDLALRLGGLVPILRNLAVTGRVFGGFSAWNANKDLKLGYFGWEIGGAAGARWMLASWFGIYGELSGSRAFLSASSWPKDVVTTMPRNLDMLRLQIEAGVILGW